MSDMQKKLARGDEIEISLKDMLWSVLGHWRAILICMLAFALLLGGYKGLDSFRKMRNTEANQAARESYEEAMAGFQSSRTAILSRMETLQREMDAQTRYRDTSRLFAIDPYNTFVSQADFYVALQEEDYSRRVLEGAELVNAYSAAAVMTDVSAVLGTESEEQGFIQVSRGLVDGRVRAGTDNNINIVDAMDGNVFTVRAFGATQEEADAILSAVEKNLTAAAAEVGAKIKAHQLVKLSENTSQTVEQSLVKLHEDFEIRSSVLTEAMSKAQTELQKLSAPSLSVTTMGTVVKQTVKYGVVGAVVGVFLSVCVYAVLFVFGNAVAGPDDLRHRYGGEILGAVPGDKKRGSLDRRILRHKGVSGSHEEKLRYLAENLRGTAAGSDAVLLVSDQGAAVTEKLAEELTPYLEGAVPATAGNVCEDAAAAKAFHAAKDLVFVTRLDRSRHGEIRRGLEKTLGAGKNVLGFVVLSD